MSTDDPSLSQAEIAAMVGRDVGTVANWTTRYPDFPPVGARTATAIQAWLTAHPRIGRAPARDAVAGGPDRRLSLGAYAVETGRKRTTLYQYARARERYGFPEPDGDGLYRLGDLTAWDQARPGQGV